MNVHGEEALRRRVPAERTHVESHTIRMNQRREETWRRLNRDRVAAFLELYLMAMLRVENAHHQGHQPRTTTNMLNKALVHRVIPWIYHHRIWTTDESQWPISVVHFRELDMYLAVHLRRVRSGHRWQMIRYFFEEIEREREEERPLEEMESRQRQARLKQVRRVFM